MKLMHWQSSQNQPGSSESFSKKYALYVKKCTFCGRSCQNPPTEKTFEITALAKPTKLLWQVRVLSQKIENVDIANENNSDALNDKDMKVKDRDLKKENNKFGKELVDNIAPD